MADAVTLLGSVAVDWQRLVTEAVSRQLTLPVAAGLRYLRETRLAAVPESVLRRLDATAVESWERWEHTLRTETPTPTPFSRLALLWFRHHRLARGRPAWEPFGFYRFIQRSLRCATPFQVPGRLAASALHHARSAL